MKRTALLIAGSVQGDEMGRTARRYGGFALVMAGAVSMAALADTAAPDEPNLRGYTLSMDKVREYAAATKALNKDMEHDKTLQAEVDAMDGEPQDGVADLKAKLAHHPKVLAYYQHQSLSLDDAVLLPLVAINAISALDAPPDQAEGVVVSTDQIAFARAHRPELEAVFMSGGGSQD